VPAGTLIEIAGNGDPARLDKILPRGERMEALDAARGTRRIAIIANGKLAAALFITQSGELPGRDWLIGQLEQASVHPAILAGRAPGAQPDRGAIVCVCFDIGMRTIISAIAEQELADVAAIGKAIGAGTNCGSCRPALARILSDITKSEALDAAE
jgi:assimilatory nitrate reductase catalytic subunit